MNVFCSHCSTGYLLPDHLLGPRGARVRCPACGKTFVVLLETAPASAATGPADAPDPEPVEPGPGAPVAAAAPEPVPPADPEPASAGRSGGADEALAHQLLGELAREKGARLERARRQGRVLAEFGPELMSVYEEYRRRLGDGGTPHAFKKVLKELWSVDLITGVET
ncbi:MAG TPA: zinc-ribbon domain-containing protein [Dongiaceae bacterium]|nr:zinc-ribbon domain-containing protein [Dongiaceae bacterium]